MVEFDPGKCEFVIAKGTLKSPPPTPTRSESEPLSAAGVAPRATILKTPNVRQYFGDSGCSESGAACDSAIVYDVGVGLSYSYQATKSHDPIHARVVAGYLGMEAQISGSCVTAGRAAWEHYWLAVTGWHRDYAQSFVTEWLSCNGFGAATYGVYTNNAFCQEFTWLGDYATVEFYNHMTVRPVYTDFEYNIWFDGNCTQLLHADIDNYRV